MNTNKDITEVYFQLRALADKTRLRTLEMVAREEGMCVTDIANALDVSVPAASYQLKELERAGFVDPERFGKTICYRLNKDNDLVNTVLRSIT